MTAVKLEISWGTENLEVEISGASTRTQIRVAGRELSCDWVRLPDDCYSLIISGCVYDLSVDLDTNTCSVTGSRGDHHFRISDPRSLSPQHGTEEGQPGLRRICAEMPGKVVRMLVRKGDKVACDQGLLVLEAMKMQNEIRSPKSGMVLEVGVEDGRAVGTGDFLLSIE